MSKHPLDYRPPTPEQVADMQLVRDAAKLLYDAIHAYVPPGRYRALALTKLEEASMFANAGIVMDAQEAPVEK